jgi:hypothetical protein
MIDEVSFARILISIYTSGPGQISAAQIYQHKWGILIQGNT